MPTMTVIGFKTSGATAWLDAAAAGSYARMRAAGCPTGGITDSGRTNAEQWVMYRLYLAGKLKATAAYPGTSKHETGLALDLAVGALAWVRAYGADYGWIKDRVANEPWHVEYVAARDTKGKTPAPTQEEDMPSLEEIDAVVRVAVAAEVAKVMRGNEFDLETTSLPAAIAAAVLGAQITRGGLGPAALADWIADGRILAGQAAERATVAIDYAALAAALAPLLVKALPSGGVSLEQVEAAVKFALGTLTLKSV